MFKHHSRRLLLFVALGAAVGVGSLNGPAANGALVCDTSWNNAAGGDWSVAANWTAGVPTSGTNTCINLAGTYTVTIAGASASTKGLEIGNANATVTLTASVAGSIELAMNADSTNAGTIELTSTSAAHTSTLHTIAPAVLTNTGTIRTLTGAGGAAVGARTFNALLTNNGGGTVAIDKTATMINSSVLTNNGGAITIANGQQLIGTGETLDNAAGSITTAGTGEVFLTNSTIKMGNGTVSGNPLRLNGGTLTFTGTGNGGVIVNGGVAHSGNIAAGQTVFIEGSVNGSSVMTSGASYTNAGTIELTSTSAAHTSTLHTIAPAVLTNTGTIRTLTGAGGAAVGARTFNALLTNNGGGTVAIDKTATMINSSVLTNNGGAITIANGQQLIGTGETLDNAAGSITTAGTGEVFLTNSTIKMGNGTVSGNPLRLNGGTLTFTGTGNGGVIVNGGVAHSGNIAAGQTVFIEGSAAGTATLSYGSPFTNAGTVRMTSSTGNTATLDAGGPGSVTNAATGSLLVEQGAGGARTTDSPIINHGTFQPGKGLQGLQSSWTYDQASAPAGTWIERVDSLTVFDHASFANTVTLGGTMSITSAITPALGTTIPNVITGSSITGTFATVSQTLWSGGLGWTPVYFPTHVDLVVADLAPPPAPAATISPDPINLANRTNVAIAGTCVPGATVNYGIADPAAAHSLTGTTACTGPGSYSVSGLDLTGFNDGIVTATVSQTTANGTGPNGTDTAAKDTIAPTATEGSVNITPAVITAPVQAAVPYSGTCVNGNGVVLTANDQHAHTVAVASFTCTGGGYSGTFNATSFTEGDTVTLSAVQTDPAGNVGPANTDTAIKTTVAPPTADPCTITITGNRASPVAVYSGQFVCIYNATVTAAVSVFPGGGVAIRQSTIGGGVSATNATSVTVCGSQLLSISATRTSGAVQIGGDSRANCPANTISGGVRLDGNQGGVELSGNQIGGTVGVTNNAGGTEVSGNRITSTLSCSGNNPPPTNAGQPNTAAAKSGQCVAL